MASDSQPIEVSCPSGAPRIASISWCCCGDTPASSAACALKSRNARSTCRNSASVRYSASETSIGSRLYRTTI